MIRRWAIEGPSTIGIGPSSRSIDPSESAMPFEVDTTYAPELLIFWLTEWPSAEHEVKLYGKLIADDLLRDDTVALIDCRSVDVPPTEHRTH
jgi:hypothetical protein